MTTCGRFDAAPLLPKGQRTSAGHPTTHTRQQNPKPTMTEPQAHYVNYMTHKTTIKHVGDFMQQPAAKNNS